MVEGNDWACSNLEFGHTLARKVSDVVASFLFHYLFLLVFFFVSGSTSPAGSGFLPVGYSSKS